jgi:hypothetical protein
MLDAQSATILVAVMRREGRSLLNYMADAYPWAAAGQGAALTAIREASSAHAAAVTALGRFLVKRRVTPPMMGAYPSYFSSCNFLAVSWILPRLVESEKDLLARLEADIKRASNADAKAHLTSFAEAKKAALARLEALAGPAAAA